jgi:sec-independent protein translocase protein TatA
MFSNLGPMELVIILVIVLVLFGARRVPEIGASLGKGIREFKRSINDVDRHLREPESDASADRLSSSTSDPTVTRNEDVESRPEPKRLIK